MRVRGIANGSPSLSTCSPCGFLLREASRLILTPINMTEETRSDGALTGQLRVTHKHEGDYLARGIKLALDGDDLNLLKSGTSTLVEVEAGHHLLRIDNTFHAKTVEFDVSAGEQVHYRVWNKRGFGSWLVEILGAGPMYLAIEKAEPLESQSVPLESPNTP